MRIQVGGYHGIFRDPPTSPPHDPGSNGPAPRILTEILDEAGFFHAVVMKTTEVPSGPKGPLSD